MTLENARLFAQLTHEAAILRDLVYRTHDSSEITFYQAALTPIYDEIRRIRNKERR